MLDVAVAYSSKHPGNVHPSTAARGHEVVIQFVGLGCEPVERGALNQEHNGVIVRIHENVPRKSSIGFSRPIGTTANCPRR